VQTGGATLVLKTVPRELAKFQSPAGEKVRCNFFPVGRRGVGGAEKPGQNQGRRCAEKSQKGGAVLT